MFNKREGIKMDNEENKDDDLKVENYNQEEVRKAFRVIKQAMKDDHPSVPGSYAHSWHCNISMACYDAIKDTSIADTCREPQVRAVCNDAATRFMHVCFDVETRG